MIVRNGAVLTGIVVALLASPLLAAEGEQDLETLAGSVVELLASLQDAFDCRFRIVAIEAIPPSRDAEVAYFATYEAQGPECSAAGDALRERGKSIGIAFFDAAFRPPPAEPVPGRILDLIHRIDPPVTE